MRFIEITKGEITAIYKKQKNKTILNELNRFLKTGYQYAIVEDNEHLYNNNNDLRRAIQYCINQNNLPIIVFMRYGTVYIERL